MQPAEKTLGDVIRNGRGIPHWPVLRSKRDSSGKDHPRNDTQELLPFSQNSNTHVSAKLVQGQETMGWYCVQKGSVGFCDVMNLEWFLRHGKQRQLFAGVGALTRLPPRRRHSDILVLRMSMTYGLSSS